MNPLLYPPAFAPYPGLLLALADAALKGLLLLILAAALTFALRKSSAAARHLVWCSALLGLLLLPAFSVVLPAWRVPWLPDWRAQLPHLDASPPPDITPIPSHPFLSPPTLPGQPPPSSTPPAISAASDNAATPTPANLLSDLPTTATTTAPKPAPVVPPPSVAAQLAHWAGLLWLLGTAFALSPLLIGCSQILVLTKRCTPVNESSWQEILAKAAGELSLRRPVRLRRGEDVNLPLTWGAWRPLLLVPTTAEDWTPERRRVVLLHELAHIKRWDWLTQMLAYLAFALYWFNPLAWVAARRMRIEREQACDDLVLRSGSRASDYAEELLQLATGLGGKSLINWATVPMARRSTLEERLRAILDGTRSHAALTRAAVLGTLALVTAIIVPIAMLRAAVAAAPASAQSSPALAQAAPTPSPMPVTAIAAGSEHSLFIKSDGSLWAVGGNLYGELGDNILPGGSKPIPVQVATDVATLAAGGFSATSGHSLFVKTDGTLWAMGRNNYGQLGDGITTDKSTPALVAANVTAVVAGMLDNYFIKTDGTLWGMGENKAGELGDGTTTAQNTPVMVAAGVRAAAAGDGFVLFIKTDGTLWGMGANGDGELGDGTTTNHLTAVQIATGVVAASAGYDQSMFIKADGTLWAMGTNKYGELGDGTNMPRTNPVQVATNVKSVSAGSFYTLFVKNDGTLWGMGWNRGGEMGDDQHQIPVQLASGVVTATAGGAGTHHILFTKTDGTLWAMGRNNSGQLGDGTRIDRHSAVRVLTDDSVPAANARDEAMKIATYAAFEPAGDEIVTQSFPLTSTLIRKLIGPPGPGTTPGATVPITENQLNLLLRKTGKISSEAKLDFSGTLVYVTDARYNLQQLAAQLQKYDPSLAAPATTATPSTPADAKIALAAFAKAYGDEIMTESFPLTDAVVASLLGPRGSNAPKTADDIENALKLVLVQTGKISAKAEFDYHGTFMSVTDTRRNLEQLAALLQQYLGSPSVPTPAVGVGTTDYPWHLSTFPANESLETIGKLSGLAPDDAGATPDKRAIQLNAYVIEYPAGTKLNPPDDADKVADYLKTISGAKILLERSLVTSASRTPSNTASTMDKDQAGFPLHSRGSLHTTITVVASPASQASSPSGASLTGTVSANLNVPSPPTSGLEKLPNNLPSNIIGGSKSLESLSFLWPDSSFGGRVEAKLKQLHDFFVHRGAMAPDGTVEYNGHGQINVTDSPENLGPLQGLLGNPSVAKIIADRLQQGRLLETGVDAEIQTAIRATMGGTSTIPPDWDAHVAVTDGWQRGEVVYKLSVEIDHHDLTEVGNVVARYNGATQMFGHSLPGHTNYYEFPENPNAEANNPVSTGNVHASIGQMTNSGGYEAAANVPYQPGQGPAPRKLAIVYAFWGPTANIKAAASAATTTATNAAPVPPATDDSGTPAGNVKVAVVIGDLRLKNADGTDRALHRGDLLHSGDTVISGTDGHGLFIYSDGTTTQLSGNSTVKLETINGNSNGSVMKLLTDPGSTSSLKSPVGAQTINAAAVEIAANNNTSTSPMPATAPALTATLTPTLPPGDIQAAIVIGDVWLKSADGTEQRLARGDKFHIEDGSLIVTPMKTPQTTIRIEDGTVVTGANGNCLLVFSNGTTMKVAGNAELKITQYKQAPFDPQAAGGTFMRLTKDPSQSVTELELIRGSITGEAKKLNTEAGSTFTIKTPSGTKNIKGTFNIMADNSNGPTAADQPLSIQGTLGGGGKINGQVNAFSTPSSTVAPPNLDGHPTRAAGIPASTSTPAGAATNNTPINTYTLMANPMIEARAVFIEMPADMKADPEYLEWADANTPSPHPDVEVTRLPAVTIQNGKEALLKVAQDLIIGSQTVPAGVELTVRPQVTGDAIQYSLHAKISQMDGSSVVASGNITTLVLSSHEMFSDGKTAPGKQVVFDLGIISQQEQSGTSSPVGPIFQIPSATGKMRHLVAVITFGVIHQASSATAAALPNPTVVIPAAAGAKNLNANIPPASTPAVAQTSAATQTILATPPPSSLQFIGYSIQGNTTSVNLFDNILRATYTVRVGETITVRTDRARTVNGAPASNSTITASNFVYNADASTVSISEDGGAPTTLRLTPIDIRTGSPSVGGNNNPSAALVAATVPPGPDTRLQLINYPDTDIRKILREVADMYELNIVIPDTLKGTTSIKLRDVTWEQVFKVVLEPIGYTFVVDDNIVTIKAKTDLATTPLQTKVIPVNNASAEDLARTLASFVDATAGESITADPRTNCLIITTRPIRMSAIQEAINRLEGNPRAQVPLAATPAVEPEKTLDLVSYPDTDVNKILREVAALYHLNLVSPDVLNGTTSIKLRNVTWEQVFKVVLEPIGYTFIQDGSTVTIKKKSDLADESIKTEVLGVQYAYAQAGMTKVLVAINPAQQDELTKALSAFLDTQTNPLESIAADPAGQHQFMIITRAEHLNNVLQTLERFGATWPSTNPTAATTAYATGSASVAQPKITPEIVTEAYLIDYPAAAEITLPDDFEKVGDFLRSLPDTKIVAFVHATTASGGSTTLKEIADDNTRKAPTADNGYSFRVTPEWNSGGVKYTLNENLGNGHETLLGASSLGKTVFNEFRDVGPYNRSDPTSGAVHLPSNVHASSSPGAITYSIVSSSTNLPDETRRQGLVWGFSLAAPGAENTAAAGSNNQSKTPPVPTAQFVVAGEVNKPGSFPLPADGSMTVARAILWAGYFTDWAVEDKVLLVRYDKDGQRQEQNVDVEAVLNKGEKEKDVKVQPGDTVLVQSVHFNVSTPAKTPMSIMPANPATPGGNPTTTATSKTPKFLVSGEVNKPGLFPFPADGSMTVVEAIQRELYV